MTQSDFMRLADRASAFYAAAFFATALIAAFAAPGIAFGPRGVVGGDFLAFHTAGRFALDGAALAAYDPATFDAAMKAQAPLDFLGMTWQYPPTVFFLSAPFALLPYKIGYVAWVLAGWGALVAALRAIGFRGRALRLLVFSPLCVAFVSHGQINCLTAALLFLAAYAPKERWLVAGIAAGLLTIKPQLGLLLPFAYLAIGAWRTIAVAAASAAALHLPALLVYGAEGWRAFLGAVAQFNAGFTGAALATPPRGMTTPFGQAKLVGLSADSALAIQYAASAALIVLVMIIWRRIADPLARAALLAAGAILAAPYAYGYEMTALLLAGAFLADKARTAKSPLGAYLGAVWLLVAAGPLIGEVSRLNTAFAIAASAFALTLAVALRPARAIELKARPA